ncbi:MAG TPA: succinate dehydrogenase, hydrophobic membrane anchor protein [Burkholderiales bacterium]|nr:succinate dehydrogenase, hydrophobic membrane anchor protein [Burkholderiales bacterium]
MRKAATGFRAWLVQRISAVYMLLFILYLLAHFIVDPPRSHLAWRGWILSPAVSIVSFAFFAALLMHAWIGLRDVTMDYVKHPGTRVFVLALLVAALLATGGWTARILLLGSH